MGFVSFVRVKDVLASQYVVSGFRLRWKLRRTAEGLADVVSRTEQLRADSCELTADTHMVQLGFQIPSNRRTTTSSPR
jgi:hypothetical protein